MPAIMPAPEYDHLRALIECADKLARCEGQLVRDTLVLVERLEAVCADYSPTLATFALTLAQQRMSERATVAETTKLYEQYRDGNAL